APIRAPRAPGGLPDHVHARRHLHLPLLGGTPEGGQGWGQTVSATYRVRKIPRRSAWKIYGPTGPFPACFMSKALALTQAFAMNSAYTFVHARLMDAFKVPPKTKAEAC